MKRIYLLLALLLFVQATPPKVKELNPTSVQVLDLSLEKAKEYTKNREKARAIQDKLSDKVRYDDLSRMEKNILNSYDEMASEDYWDILGGGCSWYCGGGPKSVKASSTLKSQGKINYKAENAHDLNYLNVWAEGVKGYGIGEYLLYTFEAASPRITEIIVVNGYVKSEAAWKNNSRVKKLKVYVDNKPYAILNLKDVRSSQTFSVDPIGLRTDNENDDLAGKPDWTIKFEIMEVYKGDKYDDVVISEIYFDGIDVHCLGEGTPVLMSDGSEKNIEELKEGDSVAYRDAITGQIKSAQVEKLEKAVHQGLVKYRFESGREIIATQDHPFMLKEKGWASLRPQKSAQYSGFENIGKVRLGDLFSTANGTDRLIAVEKIEGSRETYTISKMSAGDHFIANGLLVGVESLKN
ncbi:MAG: hypothetical protein Q3998_03160 [Porphyromonas sp.]|nr:hypothetical protein [Porphyromonas sp.]